MENRKAHRVVFERGYAANMMAIDGTWRRPCTMVDVSETGAKLTVDGSIEGLNLKEFFLLLSTMGKAYRRCQLAWVNGDQVGVFFSNRVTRRKKPKRPCGISRRLAVSNQDTHSESLGVHLTIDIMIVISSGHDW